MKRIIPFCLLLLLVCTACGRRPERRKVLAQEVKVTYMISEVADSIYESGCMTVPNQKEKTDSDFVLLSDVVPDVIQEIRYYSTYNFVGRRLPGYEEPVALLTRRAADSLKLVADDLRAKGFRLKIYDAYRPQRTVLFFIGWARVEGDTLMKPYFYPEIDKTEAFHLGYLSRRSGHSRGSTIDLTLFDMNSGKDADMGGTYDFFGEVSHYWHWEGLRRYQINNRVLLRETMESHGFRSIGTEWWHFTLIDEPYPDTYFDFPVKSEMVLGEE